MSGTRLTDKELAVLKDTFSVLGRHAFDNGHLCERVLATIDALKAEVATVQSNVNDMRQLAKAWRAVSDELRRCAGHTPGYSKETQLAESECYLHRAQDIERVLGGDTEVLRQYSAAIAESEAFN